MAITHSFTSAIPDGPDPTIVRPSNWNADHVIALSASDIPPLDYIGGAGVVGQVAEFVTDTKTLQAAKLIAPAVNILTLTNAAASTLALAITSAKTLTLTATDNFNLTIPATGTAALLGTANVFTAANTITPATDVVALTLNKATTANILNIVGTTTTSVSAAGNWGIGVAPQATRKLYVLFSSTTAADIGLRVELSTTITSGFSTSAAYFIATSNPPSNSTAELMGLTGLVLTPNTAVNHGSLFGLRFQTQHFGSGTVSGMRACYAYSYIDNASGVVTLGIGYDTLPWNNAGTFTTWIGYRVGTKAGAGTYGTAYGLQINNINFATTNYAIYTNAGLNHFGDQLSIVGSADRIQSRILANATQTANVWTLETSAAAIVNSMSLTAGAVFNEQGTDVIDFRVESDTKTNMLFLDSSANAIGINQATPTAYLHLGIGSTAAGTSPLKFTQDATSLLTAVEAGAMEYYKNALWFTNLAVRRTVVQGQSVKLTDQTIANSTTETEIFSQAHSANYLQVGKLEDIFIQGIISSLNTGLPAANALTVRIKYAGATIGTFTILKSATANRNYEIHVRVTCRAIGAGTTTMQAHANCDVEGAATDPVFNGTSTALDSTTAQATTITVQWDAASASNTTTVQQAYALSIDNNA